GGDGPRQPRRLRPPGAAPAGGDPGGAGPSGGASRRGHGGTHPVPALRLAHRPPLRSYRGGFRRDRARTADGARPTGGPYRRGGGWALVEVAAGGAAVRKTTPACLDQFRRRRWTRTRTGLLICPPLAPLGWSRQWSRL